MSVPNQPEARIFIDGHFYEPDQEVLYHTGRAYLTLRAKDYHQKVHDYKQSIAKTTEQKTGEFVRAIVSQEHRIMAVTYVNTNMKVLPTVTVTEVDTADLLRSISHTRTYINRGDQGVYVHDNHGVTMYCEAKASASQRDFIVRDTYDYVSKRQAQASLQAMQSIEEAARTPQVRLLIESLSKLCQDSQQAKAVSWRISIDHAHAHVTLQHGVSIYDPMTQCTLSTKCPEYVSVVNQQDIKYLTKSWSEHTGIPIGLCATQTLRIYHNASTPRDYYYKALGQVCRVASEVTDQVKPTVINGIVTSEMLSDYVELYVTGSSWVKRTDGGGWLPSVEQENTLVLQQRMSISKALDELGLYDTATLAAVQGDPDRADAAQLRRDIATSNAARMQAEAEILKLKQNIAAQAGMLSVEEHERRMTERAALHSTEMAALVAKHSVSMTEKVADVNAKVQDHSLAVQREEIKNNSEVVKAASAASSASASNTGESIKLVAVGIGATAAVATAVVKLAPMVTSLVSAFMFGAAASAATPVVAAAAVSAGVVAGAGVIKRTASYVAEKVGNAVSGVCSSVSSFASSCWSGLSSIFG